MKMLILPTSFLLLAGLAVADPGTKFEQLDQNRDGGLTPDEVIKTLPVEFKAADRNGDGALDEQEFAAVMNPEGKRKSAGEQQASSGS